MVVVCSGGGQYAAAALAYSLVVAVEDPTDRGPRARQPISRGLGGDVGFNRRLVQSDWKHDVSVDLQRRMAQGKKRHREAPNMFALPNCAVAHSDKRCGNFRDCATVGSRWEVADKPVARRERGLTEDPSFLISVRTSVAWDRSALISEKKIERVGWSMVGDTDGDGASRQSMESDVWDVSKLQSLTLAHRLRGVVDGFEEENWTGAAETLLSWGGWSTRLSCTEPRLASQGQGLARLWHPHLMHVRTL
jgi:hypothetical protein